LDLQLPTLSSSYIELITKYSRTQVNSLSVTMNDIDMYDWIEEVGWDNVSKLIQHMRLIPNVSIYSKQTMDMNNQYLEMNIG
jgi:hypothetical protein